MKVAILDFLSSAVETQPGLMELFLDFIQSPKSANKVRPVSVMFSIEEPSIKNSLVYVQGLA